MAALDLGHVEEARGVADQQPARKRQLRDRLETTLVDGARAVSNPAPAFEGGPDRRMRLEALEFLERIQERVLVVEADHEADGHLIVLEVVKKRAAVGLTVHRPAD